MAKTGFVSEAGAHGFSFDGARDARFSLTAVLVEEENKREVGEGFLRIRERHFPEGSARFGEGPLFREVRSAFLEELKELSFSFHALVVDKRKLLQKSPLSYKSTFYKFLSGFIYNNLYRTVPHLSVVASPLGTPSTGRAFTGPTSFPLGYRACSTATIGISSPTGCGTTFVGATGR